MRNSELEVHPGAKGLIFDLDGTIADTMPVHFIAYKNLVAPFGIDFTPELFDTLAGVPAVQTIERLNKLFGTSMDPEIYGHLKEQAYEKMMHRMKPVEPVIDLIKRYHNILPMAIGTGGYKKLAWKALEIIGMKDYFPVLVSSEDVTNHKPHPETFLKCAEKMGIEPQFCHVFEDGDLGIAAARAAGMFTTDVRNYYTVTIGKAL